MDALHLATAIEDGCERFLTHDVRLRSFPDIVVECPRSDVTVSSLKMSIASTRLISAYLTCLSAVANRFHWIGNAILSKVYVLLPRPLIVDFVANLDAETIQVKRPRLHRLIDPDSRQTSP